MAGEFISDFVLDLALAELDTNANRLDITSQVATTYTEAITTYTLGNKTSLSVGAPANATPNGRHVVVAAITDGSVTGTATATHWAIVDTVNTRLLATGPLSASQSVTSGNTFTLDAITIRFPDAVVT